VWNAQQFDLVGIYDALSDAVTARSIRLPGALGNVRTTSMRPFPEEAYRQIVHSLH
jgi:uncharacterized protein with GYD domain